MAIHHKRQELRGDKHTEAQTLMTADNWDKQSNWAMKTKPPKRPVATTGSTECTFEGFSQKYCNWWEESMIIAAHTGLTEKTNF